MKYLLDTDHLSVLQRRTGAAYQNLLVRMAGCALSDFGVSIVTVHEQFLGIHDYINRAKRLSDLIVGYVMFSDALKDYLVFDVVEFDDEALQCFDALSRQKKQLAVMDARIASTAQSRGLIVLTRNNRDFAKVPGLKFEDWTMAEGRSETIAP
jgi:tRNA(fMet)-specific endonuclease VapC